jgi:hypothetical protein
MEQACRPTVTDRSRVTLRQYKSHYTVGELMIENRKLRRIFGPKKRK